MEESRSPVRWRVAARFLPILLTTLALSACFEDKSASDAAAGSVSVQSTGASASNAAPVVAGTPATEIPAGFPYVFKPSVTDPDGDAVTFEIQGTPRWATFDAAVGELRGTPTDADVGDSTGIFIKASDGKASTTFGPFAVKVKRASVASGTVGARAPTISGTPSTTVVAGTGYAFQAIGADPDGDRLLYGATNLPSWLGINTANGILSGTPSAAQVGVYSNISISVTDGSSTASLPAFSISVTASGTSSGTTASSTNWTQCASEGGTCSFSGTKQVRYGEPFNDRWTAARILTGPVACSNDFWTDPSPGTAKRCEVLDSLVIVPTTPTTTTPSSTGATGTATLVWVKPTQNTDGSALVDLSGFIIKYGTDPASLSQTVTLTDPNATRHTVQNLGSGTWYFTVASLTAAGLESALTPLVSKTI